MKKAFLIVNLLLVAAVLASDCSYILHGTLRIKAITSLLFTMIGAVNLAYAFIARAPKHFSAIMFAGLTFAMLGDIFLRFSFIGGALFFGLGHVLYFAAFCRLASFKHIDVIPAAAVFAASALLILCYPKFRFGGILMQNVCLVYALVISFMVGKAFSNFLHERTAVNGILALGSAMFYFSDLMLVLYKFSAAPHFVDTLCLMTYFPAQCLLGFSGYLHVSRSLCASENR